MSDTTSLDPEIAAIIERYEATLAEWLAAAERLIEAINEAGFALVADICGED